MSYQVCSFIEELTQEPQTPCSDQQLYDYSRYGILSPQARSPVDGPTPEPYVPTTDPLGYSYQLPTTSADVPHHTDQIQQGSSDIATDMYRY